jgi:multicomponent K+:H+ antiporter subunit G
MSFLVEILITFFLVVGGFFALVGSFGLLKLDNLMARLHAPTKASTLGIGGMLIASMLYFALVENAFSFHELLITVFIFLTAPITANFIAKAHLLRQNRPDKLPETRRDCGWATFDEPKRNSAHPLPHEE